MLQPVTTMYTMPLDKCKLDFFTYSIMNPDLPLGAGAERDVPAAHGGHGDVPDAAAAVRGHPQGALQCPRQRPCRPKAPLPGGFADPYHKVTLSPRLCGVGTMYMLSMLTQCAVCSQLSGV